MATHTVYATADGTKTGWTGVGDTSNLWANVDEDPSTPTDADYIQSDVAAAVQTIYLRLGSMPGDFDTATGVSITIRISRDSGKLCKSFDTVRLYRTNESTVVTAAATVSATTTSPVNTTYTPSITGGTDSTTWNDLALQIKTNGIIGIVYMQAFKVVVTYTAAAASGQPTIARQTNVPFVSPRLSRRIFGYTGIFAPPAPAGFGRRGGILVPSWLAG